MAFEGDANPLTMGEAALEPLSRSGEELSIVVQGELTAANLAEVATVCSHWREVVPGAEIILAISVSDVLALTASASRELDDLPLTPEHRYNGGLQAAVARLKAACNAIVLSSGALPLPPIKFDRKTNNVNLQLAAGRAGIARASRPYLLRIRSDLYFLDASFVEFYLTYANLPRRGSCLLKQRVMISPYFTLNPYTLERIPFHFSDWFHLGLTEDVRKLWPSREMSLAVGTHYAWHRHSPRANRLERKFRVKYAVEQFITYSSLVQLDSRLGLKDLIDQSSARDSIEILLRDFLIYDPKAVPTVFDKYEKTFRDPHMELLCVTYPQWRSLLALPPSADYLEYYAADIKRARREIAIRENPAWRPVRIARGLWRRVWQSARQVAAGF